jgi:hypothetical protein
MSTLHWPFKEKNSMHPKIQVKYGFDNFFNLFFWKKVWIKEKATQLKEADSCI